MMHAITISRATIDPMIIPNFELCDEEALST